MVMVLVGEIIDKCPVWSDSATIARVRRGNCRHLSGWSPWG